MKNLIFFFWYLGCFDHTCEGCSPKYEQVRKLKPRTDLQLSLTYSQEPSSYQKMNCPSPKFQVFFSSVVQQSDFDGHKDRLICPGFCYHQTALELSCIHKNLVKYRIV